MCSFDSVFDSLFIEISSSFANQETSRSDDDGFVDNLEGDQLNESFTSSTSKGTMSVKKDLDIKSFEKVEGLDLLNLFHTFVDNSVLTLEEKVINNVGFSYERLLGLHILNVLLTRFQLILDTSDFLFDFENLGDLNSSFFNSCTIYVLYVLTTYVSMGSGY